MENSDFFDLTPARDGRTHLSAVERLSIPVSALAGGWLVYEPILNLVHLRGPGSGDEIAAIGASVVAAALALAASTVDSACESGPTYRQKRWTWRGSGAIAGLGLGAALVGLDLISTGGLGTLVGSALAAKLGVGISFAGGGAVAGERANQHYSQKKCRVCGRRARCCDRICLRCGHIFNVDRSWCERSIDTAEVSLGDRLTFGDVVSIFDCLGLGYPEFCAALEENAGSWSPPNVSGYAISKRKFFSWLRNSAEPERKYEGKRPSPDFWVLTEKAVRSECEPDSEIKLHDIGHWPHD